MAKNAGYEIRQSILFNNGRGFALAHDPKAPNPYVTWQFGDEGGRRDYFWGHYFNGRNEALADFNKRVYDYERQFGVQRVETKGPDFYKYYSTQRPVDIGGFPRPKDNLPVSVLNYPERRPVENGSFRAWGELLYLDPLTEKDISDYELRPAPDNVDVRRRMDEQVQTVGKWEDAKRVPEVKRLTWYYSDFGAYVPKEFVTPEQLAACCRDVELQEAARAHKEAQKAKPSISEQLAKGTEQVAKENATRPAPEKKPDKER